MIQEKDTSDVLANWVAHLSGRTDRTIPRGTVGGRGTNICHAYSNLPWLHVYDGGLHMLSKDWWIPSMTFLQVYYNIFTRRSGEWCATTAQCYNISLENLCNTVLLGA